MGSTKAVENTLPQLLSGFSIYNQKSSFGNQILYDMCDQNKNPWGDPNRLADKIWLIGRSYAASPERRYTDQLPLTAEEKKTINHGDGTGEYFYYIAQYLCNDMRLSQLAAQISTLLPLRFDGSKNDIEALLKSIGYVALFNNMIKDASSDYEKHRNKLIHSKLFYRNQISFCSKFLHFHAPHNIFIIDHFSQEGGRFLYSTQTRKSIKLKNCDIVIDKAIREAIHAYHPHLNISVKDIGVDVGEKAQKAVECYISHCLYSYGFGYFLHNKMKLSPENSLCPFPRIVDSIFQNTTVTG